MDRVVSKAELARELSVSKARISQMVASGLPVRGDGRIDLNSAIAWVNSHVDRGRTARPAPDVRSAGRPAAPVTDGAHFAAQQDPARVLMIARAKKLLVDVRRAEREERRHAGELIELREAQTYAAEFSHIVRDGILSQADRLTARVAGAASEADVYRILREDGLTLLSQLSKAIANSGMTGPAVGS